MRKVPRLLLLLGALGVVAVCSRPAYALPICDDLQGGVCHTEGQVKSCTFKDHTAGVCFCFEGHWDC